MNRRCDMSRFPPEIAPESVAPRGVRARRALARQQSMIADIAAAATLSVEDPALRPPNSAREESRAAGAKVVRAPRRWPHGNASQKPLLPPAPHQRKPAHGEPRGGGGGRLGDNRDAVEVAVVRGAAA